MKYGFHPTIIDLLYRSDKVMKKFIFFENASCYKEDSSFVAHLSQIVDGKIDLLNKIKTILNFPEYFGYNWDALDECLNDFHWIKEKKIILVHDYLPKLSDIEMHKYLDILIQAVSNWNKNEEHEFEVVFQKKDESFIKLLMKLKENNFK